MNNIALFEKVSFDTFKKDYITFSKLNSPMFNSYDSKPHAWEVSDEFIQRMYDNIILPVRATSGSAGYDFVTPISFILPPMGTIKIPSGIKCNIDTGWVMMCYPRSSYGFNWRLQFDNTTPVVDSDFYNNEFNEGHIAFQITNDSKRPPVSKINHITGERVVMPDPDSIAAIKQGDRICQAVFTIYGLTKDDNTTNIRTGTSGSTGK